MLPNIVWHCYCFVTYLLHIFRRYTYTTIEEHKYMLRNIILCDEESYTTYFALGKSGLSVLDNIFASYKNITFGSAHYHTHTHKHTYTPNIRSPFAYPGGGAYSRSVCVPLRGAIKNAKGTFFRFNLRFHFLHNARVQRTTSHNTMMRTRLRHSQRT